MSITNQKLTLAGWLSITNAVVTVPIFVFSLIAVTAGGAGAKAIDAIFQVVSLGLFIYIISSLRSLLNFRFRFYDVDTYISALIWLSVVSVPLGLRSSGGFGFVDVLLLIVLIATAIVLIVFGVKILHLSDKLYGLVKPFAYTQMAAGLCIGTIVLAPVALIVSAVGDVILGMIFFRAAEQPVPAGTVVNYKSCAQCGSHHGESDQFCGACGARLA